MKRLFHITVTALVVIPVVIQGLSCDIFNLRYREFKRSVSDRFRGKIPVEWSETAAGVITKLPVTGRVIALTFDACGSSGDGYDRELMDYLVRQGIHATLFINSRWIDKNRDIFLELAGARTADNELLFEIENHGWKHKPCSVNGRSIYKIAGTGSPEEVVDEIEKNGIKILELTGRKPRFYRSGTAYYDEYAVQIAGILGYKVIGFSVLGDAGATYTAEQVEEALLSCEPGSIVICHFNRPEKETYEGIVRAIPRLKKRGYRFVKLEDFL